MRLRILLSFLAASVTGLVLYFRFPFPEMNVFLNLIKVKDLPTFYFLKYSYVSFLFATPFFAFSLLTSFLYLFVFNSSKKTVEALHAAALPGSSAARRTLSGPG